MTTHKTLSKKEVINTIQKEINWIIKYRNKCPYKETSSAVISGLRLAIYLVRELKIDNTNSKQSK